MTQQRFTALDVFRGMTVCFMIIVNTPGNGATTYAPLLHAQWHGFTPTDLVFPSFLFAVGNAMSFVMPRWESLSPGAVSLKILKRTALIFLLGFAMYWFPFVKRTADGLVGFPLSDTRIFGVLQRIALCYGISAFLLHFLKTKTTVWLVIGFNIAYWIILLTCGQGADPFDMQTNAGTLLDKWLIGDAHLYHGEGVAFDPEGLLSTFPALGNVVGGFLVGKFIREKGATYETLSKLLLAGAGLLFLAYCWNMWFPVNKKLWTGSFVSLTVGLDCILISAIIHVIEFRKITGWTYFFEVFGKNPLIIYLLSEIGAILLWFFVAAPEQSLYQWLYIHWFQPAGDYFGSFLFAIAIMLSCWLVGYLMDKRKIYIRV